MSLTSHTKNSATLSAAKSTPRSLYDAILGETNSLNFLRLSLASLVIVAHAAPLVGLTLEFSEFLFPNVSVLWVNGL